MKKILALAAAVIAAGYFVVENRQLRVTEYTVRCRKLPKSFEGKKILLLADLHNKRYGDNFNNLMDSCIALDPDWIFFAGDLYSKSDNDLFPKAALMGRLKQLAPVYYVVGNHEIRNTDNMEALCCKLKKSGIHVLRNRQERIYCGEDFVNIYGTQLPMRYYMNRDGSYRNLPGLDTDSLTDLLGEADKDHCNLLLTHNPFFLDTYAQWGADLVFSGHCHGGIIRLPFIGGLFSPERKLFPKYTKGVYTSGKTSMVLSAGLGKFRLNNPSEIVLCTLKGESENG